MDRFAHYTLIRRLARGGLGDVWLAQDPNCEDPNAYRAIKVLIKKWRSKPAVVARFLAQGHLACTLQHPHIVRTRAVDTHGEIPYWDMTYINGWTLRTLMQRIHRKGNGLPERVALWIGAQLLVALSYTHAQGIAHHDLSPSNVLIARSGAVYLSDFHCAPLDDMPHATACAPWGKNPYHAPEPATGHIPPMADDLYGIGVLLYEMLWRERPKASSISEACSRMACTLQDRHALLSKTTIAVLTRALHPDPHARFDDAASMLDAVQQALQHLSIDDDQAALAALGAVHDRPLFNSGIAFE